MTKPTNNTVINTLIIIANFTAIIGGFIGLYIIYQNSKTDGFGNGDITVQSCEVKDAAWQVYVCKGNYHSSKGMIGKNNASVTVFGTTYGQGENITDVYPAAFTNLATTDHFVTGREQASVTYNIPWLIAVYLGLSTPLATALFLYLEKSKRV